jgi:D-sedoheptulose 7-phosphate isomerase
MAEHLTQLLTTIDESARTIAGLKAIARQIAEAQAMLCQTLDRGGMVLTCGNGGSAAEALHLAEELIGRYKRDRRPLRSVCLNADPTALTCIGNDFGYDHIFARQLEGLARPGDCLVAFTTSGKSPNVLLALEAAQRLGVRTIGMLGKGGGPAAPLCDCPLIVPSDATERIQEAHQLILHLLLDAAEPAATA